MARIYVGTYAKYNNGSIAGQWLDLDDYSDSEEFYAACRELHSDESDPELMFQDWEDIPDQYIGESYLSDDYWTFRDTVDESYLDEEVFLAGLWLDIPLENIEDAYQGEYSSDEDFAQQLAEDIGAINADFSWPHSCIDWEQAARELMYDYSEHDGYYFSNNW